MQALESVLRNLTNTRSRASRSEFWWWVGWYVLAEVLIVALATFLPIPELVELVVLLVGLWALFAVLVSASARRLHDQGHSGWWLLLAFLPVVGGLLVLIMMFLDGEPRPNRWGPPPAGSTYADPQTWEPPEVI